MFGKCKACEEKDKRIADLKSQIDFLQLLSQPQEKIENKTVHLEANAILSGHQEQIISYEDEEVIAERERILSGNY